MTNFLEYDLVDIESNIGRDDIVHSKLGNLKHIYSPEVT